MTAQMDTVDHRQLKRPNKGYTTYDEQDKLFALAVYAETGSQTTASERTGIPATTIHGWLKHPETDAKLEELRIAIRRRVAFTCAEASQLAAQRVVDVLVNGEEVIINNEIHRVKVKGKDAAYIFGMMTDRHAMLTQGIQGKNTSDMLDQLAAKLVSKMKGKAEPQVIESSE
jgi:hypothetical protein